MSRIGNKKVKLPAGVNVEVSAEVVKITGPKGTLEAPLFPGITIEVADGSVSVKRDTDVKQQRAYHGLVRSLIANCITGTSEGFSKNLQLQGVGYRAQKKGNSLVMTLGFSHEINMAIPQDVNVECPEPTKVIVSGIDKQRVGQVSAVIRSYRPPEPYKGKGIRYSDEIVRRKAGKAGKK
ncbi:MAG: 50S ribosomal protein L6 [Leptospirales bacterium]